jgi:nitroreductase
VISEAYVMDLETVDKLLTTTRSVRKRLDLTRPVEPEIIEECIDIAVQAPSGSNAQGWHFLVITDADKRAAVGAIYKRSWDIYAQETRSRTRAQRENPDQMQRVRSSAAYLAENMGRVPVLILACIEGRVETLSQQNQAGFYGSILPAAWSLMLALRSRGLGSAWTTLHLRYEKEAAQVLGIPDNVTQAVLLPVAYYSGEDFQPAKRLPGAEVTSWNTWGGKR